MWKRVGIRLRANPGNVLSRIKSESRSTIAGDFMECTKIKSTSKASYIEPSFLFFPFSIIGENCDIVANCDSETNDVN